MTISELIELLQEIMEKEGDLGVAYVYNDGGYPMMGEEYVGGESKFDIPSTATRPPYSGNQEGGES